MKAEKLVASVLGVLLMVSLSACGSASKSDKTSSTTSPQSATSPKSKESSSAKTQASYEIFPDKVSDYQKRADFGDGAGNTKPGMAVLLPAGTYEIKSNAKNAVQLTFYNDYQENGVNEKPSKQRPVVIKKLETTKITIHKGEFFKISDDMKGTLTCTQK